MQYSYALTYMTIVYTPDFHQQRIICGGSLHQELVSGDYHFLVPHAHVVTSHTLIYSLQLHGMHIPTTYMREEYIEQLHVQVDSMSFSAASLGDTLIQCACAHALWSFCKMYIHIQCKYVYMYIYTEKNKWVVLIHLGLPHC